MTPQQAKEFAAMEVIATKCAEAVTALLGTVADLQARVDELQAKQAIMDNTLTARTSFGVTIGPESPA